MTVSANENTPAVSEEDWAAARFLYILAADALGLSIQEHEMGVAAYEKTLATLPKDIPDMEGVKAKLREICKLDRHAERSPGLRADLFEAQAALLITPAPNREALLMKIRIVLVDKSNPSDAERASIIADADRILSEAQPVSGEIY